MSEDKLHQQKQAYDQAQKVGERVEVMATSKGWQLHFIPKIQKLRDSAQEIINDPKSDIEMTQHARGMLKAYDEVLGYADETMKNQRAIMHRNATAKVRDSLD